MSDSSGAISGSDAAIEPPILWNPPVDFRETTRLGLFLQWLDTERSLRFDGYDELWKWSTSDLEGFWRAIWDYFEVIAHAPPTAVLESRAMPGARWFPGAQLNYAEHALRFGADAEIAIVARSQTRPDVEMTWGELRSEVARIARGLRDLGVQPGDRVGAYLPSTPEAVVAFLASASIGAVWCACPPEFGVRSAADRLGQVEPKVIFAVDGYRWGDRVVDRTETVSSICDALPSLQHVVLLPYLNQEPVDIGQTCTWAQMGHGTSGSLSFEAVEFDHPLWILFSSGTTGLPKPIVHGHGGMVLEQFKSLALLHNLDAGDRMFFYSTTGWMVWNQVVSSLLIGATIVLLDGNPVHPELGAMWQLAEDTGVSLFGASASFHLLCMENEMSPAEAYDLSAVTYIKSAGSVLPPVGYRWLAESFPGVFINSSSGGTDVCSGLVGGVPILPAREGEMAGALLGVKAEAFDEEGKAVVGEYGELVMTEPMPSMPLYFHGDSDGSRYRDAYFERFPGVWAHGDWIKFTDRGTCVLGGRSDATLNRGGVRLGTNEFYSVLDAMDQVEDSLVIHLDERDGGMGELLVFIVPSEGTVLDKELRDQVAKSLREELSPRHVPDDVIGVASVPRGLTGKRLEVPVKRILQGADPDVVYAQDSIAESAAIEPFVAMAAERSENVDGARRS